MPAPAPDRGRFAAVIALPGTRMPWLGCGMPPTSHLLAFALISFALIIVPGPNVIFVVTRSLMLGRPAGLGTAMGRDRWPGDDRDRGQPGRHRPPRLTGRAGARNPFGLRAP